jgi:two-component system phosphate regulon response regulator OmpR
MNGKLLLIDDDARLTAMVGDYLRANGYEVETAASLAAGRDKLRGGPYDALVLDLMLPDGDGLDLTRELRADPRLKRLPLLMLTARGEPLDRVIGLDVAAPP